MALSDCDRRILLLGKNSSESRRIGNLILNRDAFDTEAPPPSVEQHSEKVRGKLGERYITLINTPHLFDPHLSVKELNHKMRDCMSLCSPGPHVVVLVLQPDDFTETDRDRLHHILVSFSGETNKHIMVLTTQKLQSGVSVDPVKENVFQKIITECNSRQIEFRGKCSRVALMNMIERMIEENEGSYLKCGEYEALATREQTTLNKSEKGTGSRGYVVKKAQDHKDISVPLEKRAQKQHEITPTQSKSEQIMEEMKTLLLEDNIKSNEKLCQRLNLVLCGHNRAVKSSISDLILGQKELSPESSSVCVRREGEVCGRLVTLVEMPALYNTQLSEEEVMQETLRCVSLCDPGVHAFLLIASGGRLTDDDKGEIEKIQKIFSSKVSEYLVVLFTMENVTEQNPEAKNVVNCGQRSIIVKIKMGGNPKQVSELLEEIKRLTEPKHYSLHTYMKAQEEKIRHELEEKNLKVTRLLKDERQKTEDVRIVLLGKTGVGKSATANIILGKNVYRELLCARSVTTECQKESSDDTYNVKRRITVIDTPGLFDTKISNEEISKEIVKCITMAAPGPHVFLLIIALGRFTKEEQDAVKTIQELFGEESRRYTMVLFTRGDDLQKMSIEEFIKNSDLSLQNIIHQCGNRYHVFNNRNTEDRSQVTDLLEKIDSMVTVNGGNFYTNEMFQRAEKALQKEQNRILKDKKEEIERKKEELRKKHEAESEKMKKALEEEEQKEETEMKKREEEFKEREEQMKREFAGREQLKERQREEDQRQREQEEEKEKEKEELRKKFEAEIEKMKKAFEEERQKQERERKRREEEFKEREEQIKREFAERERLKERQREEDQRQREQEEKERRKKEEEWKKQQEEMEKIEKEKKEMIQKQRDHQKKLQQEYEQKAAEEEKRRRALEEKIRHAEESKRKELQQLQLTQQREWERRKQEENKLKEKRKSLENEWIFQQHRKQQQYEEERKAEMERRALEEVKNKQKEEEEKKRIENELNEKIKQMQMRIQRETEAREQLNQKQLEEKLKSQRELFHKSEEERARARKEEVERHVAHMREIHELKKEKLRKEIELAVRKEAEKEFCDKLERKLKETQEGQGSNDTGAQNTSSAGGFYENFSRFWGYFF